MKNSYRLFVKNYSPNQTKQTYKHILVLKLTKYGKNSLSVQWSRQKTLNNTFYYTVLFYTYAISKKNPKGT